MIYVTSHSQLYLLCSLIAAEPLPAVPVTCHLKAASDFPLCLPVNVLCYTPASTAKLLRPLQLLLPSLPQKALVQICLLVRHFSPHHSTYFHSPHLWKPPQQGMALVLQAALHSPSLSSVLVRSSHASCLAQVGAKGCRLPGAQQRLVQVRGG